jgi:predicted RND superfamily exporter protein
MFLKYRKGIIIAFLGLTLVSGFYIPRLSFSFSFDQFFPKNDPDLEFYKEFVKDFDTDDNFLLIALAHKPSVFDSVFLTRVHHFGLDLAKLPLVVNVQSLTKMVEPIRTPFGFSAIPVLDVARTDLYDYYQKSLPTDGRFVNNLIDSSGTSLVVATRTKAYITNDEARALSDSVDSLLAVHQLQDQSKILGRAYFQRELIDFQKKEMVLSFFASIFLVTVFMFFLYRKAIGIAIALVSIALGLWLFMGFLGLIGAELTAISALFPVIMLIVGSSDVIHIFSKYVDELNMGRDKAEAMRVTIQEIGVATFMTSFTTAIGFASLATSRLGTIQSFGLYAAAGVMIAFITVLFFTTSVLSYFPKEKIIKQNYNVAFWNGFLNHLIRIIFNRRKLIFGASLVCCILFIGGIQRIETNYKIVDNLPKGAKVTNDFLFFEEHYAGFRPMEYAIMMKDTHSVYAYEAMKSLYELEQKIRSYDAVRTSTSVASICGTIYNTLHRDSSRVLTFPPDEALYNESLSILKSTLKDAEKALVSDGGDKARISCRMKDVGADSIKTITKEIHDWYNTQLDTSLFTIKETGTGVILDKNATYVTENLLQGLGLSLLIIGLLMGLLFKSTTMVFIALTANVIPLLFGGAVIGYSGIQLDAGIAIMFSVIFGIAVDDTIHYLSRYKLCIQQGLEKEDAIRRTTLETGKAIIYTSIILFFGFLNLIFSESPPTFTIGLLISFTLFSALIADLILLPALILRFMK